MKNVNVKFQYYGKSRIIEVVEIDGNKVEEMVFFEFNEMVEFLPEYLQDFYNTTIYTLQEIK